MSDTTPTFTVIVALYNCERYIAECLGSLRTQSFDDFEAIVVDDCSTDDGLRVAKAAVTDDERFRFLSTPILCPEVYLDRYPDILIRSHRIILPLLFLRQSVQYRRQLQQKSNHL